MKIKRKTKCEPLCEEPLGSQIEHNEALKAAFHSATIKTIEFVSLKNGVLPNGTAYEGPGFALDCGNFTLLLVPHADDFEFFIGSLEDPRWEPDREKMAMHAADHLEDECRRHGSHASRFRNATSTVYVALDTEVREAFDALYESRFQKKVIQ